MRILLLLATLDTIRGFAVAPLQTSSDLHRPAYQGCAMTRLRAVDFDGLMEMDVVIYSEKENGDQKCIGAIQEDGTLSPLSAWSEDPAFGDSVEFLVDEEDRFPGLRGDQIIVHSIIPEESLSYGSRQVGGGKGPGNPHGEESELLYYVDQSLLGEVEFKINPDLEILW